MASYYKHTRTVRKNVPYNFICEHCNKDSGPLAAEITATATKNKNSKNISQQEVEKLEASAAESFDRYYEGLKKAAIEKQDFFEEFKDKCPHCGKPQSWAVKTLASTPWVYGTVLGVIGIGTAYMKADSILTGVGIIAALFAIGAIAGYIKVAIKKSKTKDVLQKRVPEIHWL